MRVCVCPARLHAACNKSMYSRMSSMSHHHVPSALLTIMIIFPIPSTSHIIIVCYV